MKNTPRGIRNHNPGNIEHGARWKGLSPHQSDRRFATFDAPHWGIRAIARTLITYQDRRRARDGGRIDSPRKIAARWAPPHENDTGAYSQALASALGIGPDDGTVDVRQRATLRALVCAIIRHENGPGPGPEGQWYPRDVIDRGLDLAATGSAENDNESNENEV